MNKINYRNYEYVIVNNIHLVYKIASRFNVNTDNEKMIIDAGMIGLLEAAVKFDISKKDDFSKFAVRYILKAIKKEFRKEKIEYRA